MKDLKELEGRLIKEAALIGGIVVAALLILQRYNLSTGILIGTLVSIVNFKLLARDVVKKTSQSTQMMFFRISGGYILRYGLMAIALIIAAKKGVYYFLGVAIGLFAIRIAIFIDTFFISKWKSAKYLQKL